MVAFAALTATMTDTFVAALGVIALMVAFQILGGHPKPTISRHLKTDN